MNKTKKDQTLVTIIIPCYNYGRYLKKAVQSAIDQTYPNIEIIIIDDGSTDSTENIGHTLQSEYPNVSYYRQVNKGIVKTRNLGIELARGDYFLQLDADDYLDNNYVQETLSVAKAKNADIVYTDYVTFGRFGSKSNFPEYNLEELKNHNFINISCLIRKSSVGSLRFDDNLAGLTHEDWDFFLALCLQGCSAVKCHTTVLHYRLHDTARNNQFRTLDDKRRYVDVYAYVIEKQSKKHPSQFEYLVGRVFTNWYVAIDDIRMEQQKNLHKLQVTNKRLIEQKVLLERTLEDIVNTRKFRIVNQTAKIVHPVKATKNIAKTKAEHLQENQDARISIGVYKSSGRDLQGMTRRYNKKTAVILHLYYTELWQYFAEILLRLKSLPYDLFITIPHDRAAFKDTIKQSYPEAYVVTVPNRGRDVLPFLWLMAHIQQQGYDNILKLHSKRSKHRVDGQEWLGDMVNKLVPSSKSSLEVLMDLLSRKDTGLVGPAGHYISLIVNFIPNRRGLNHVLNRIFPQQRWEAVSYLPENYGFFEGTMFWARTDALSPIIDAAFGVTDFKKEKGQIDATLAHSLERAFCIVPEMMNKKMYEIDNSIINLLPDYSTDNIPDWSKVERL